MNVYQRVKVYDAPYYPEGWDIWAEIDGVETHLSHNEVASSLLICMTEEEAERCTDWSDFCLPMVVLPSFSLLTWTFSPTLSLTTTTPATKVWT